MACDAVEPWTYGSVLRTPSAPEYWDCNLLRVEGARPDLGAASLIAAADELLAGLGHRKIEVEDQATGARLRPAFAAAGWHTERLALMLRTGPPPPATDGVEEVPLPATRTLRAEWYVYDAADPDAMRRFAAEQEPIGARRGLRAFVIRGDDPAAASPAATSPAAATAAPASPVAFATLAPGDGAVEIDQLYVTPAHRGRGLGAALVAGALNAGGTERAWIEADDEDRPRRLYERLGFATVWRRHAFTLPPPALS